MKDRKSYALESVQMTANQVMANKRAHDQAIRRARQEGASCAEIADAAGMSREGVRKLLARAPANSVDKTARSVVK